MKNSIIILLLLHLALVGFSQEMEIGYDISGTYKKPILKEKLDVAKTINDINPGFPSSWISNYVSMEISATCKGKVMKAESANDQLSDEQIGLLKMADLGTDINVDVKYYPKNSQKDSDIKSINFSYTLIPKVEAKYPGGHQLLKQYLKETAIDKIPETIIKQIQLAKVGFIIDEKGQITDTQITESSGNEDIDNLLLQTINNMQKWLPAQNSKGINVKQEFEFSVGYMIGC